MRKMLCWALIMGLLAAACATATAEEPGAESSRAEPSRLEEPRRAFMLAGSVVAGETVTATAPFGGAVDTVLVKQGDFVATGQTLLTLSTTKVYAPCDGTVGSLRAQAGDDVAYVQDRYGALLYVEPTSLLIIETDTKYAYVADENYMIHVGETVYIGSRTNNTRTGVGFITQADDDGYTIEVTEGNLIVGDGVSIFRTRNLAPASKIGSGTTARNTNVPITSEGSVFRVHVSQGDAVKRGDVLLETVGGATAYNPLPTNRVLAESAAIVATVDVSVGTSATKNQVLATLYPINGLQVAVDVLEADLQNVRVGDTVRIELVSFFDQEPLTGTVASISGLSSSTTDDAQYTVTIDFNATDLIRLGMSVNVYFNE